MMYRDSQTAYGRVTKFIHNGLVAVWVIVELILGVVLKYLPSGNLKGQLFTFHKSVGIVISLVALIFLLWRLANRKPAWSVEMPLWERLLARVTHSLLYLIIIVMPFTGWGMSTAAGFVPDFFWLFPLPLPWIPLSKPLAKLFSELHYIFAWVLAGLIALHIIAALKHHFIDKDNILKRMWHS